MRKLSKHQRRCNPQLAHLSLFAWAACTERGRLPLPARWVARHCGLTPSMVAVLAEHVFRGDQR